MTVDFEKGLLKIGRQGGKGEYPDKGVVEFLAKGMASYGEHLATEVGAFHGKLLPELAEPVGEASSCAARMIFSAVEAGQEKLEPLSRDRRRIVFETLDRVTYLLLHAAYEENLSGRQLCERGRLAVETVDLVITHPDPERLNLVAEALEPVEVDDPVEERREEAEARARLRLHALYQRIVRDSYSVKDLRARVSRQRLKQLRDEDRLFAIDVPFFKGMLYPRWQFELDTGKPRAIMPELIRAGRQAGMDAIAFHQTMLSPAAGGGDLTPVDLLDAGEEEAVLRILQAGDQ